MVMEILKECCHSLDSTKITERKKGLETLRAIITKKDDLDYLNGNLSDLTWSDIIASVHRFLLREAVKFEADENRKRTVSESTVSFNAGNVSSILMDIVQTVFEKECNIQNCNVLIYVFEFFESHLLMKYFSKAYLCILMDHVLSKKYWHYIKFIDWKKLFRYLKNLIQNPVVAVDELQVLKCIGLVFEYGNAFRINLELMREFSFVMSIAQQLKASSSRTQQITVLQILLNFLNQVVEDNRLVSCRLGEEVFRCLVALYQNQTDSSIKVLIFEILLLQVQIHHPNGVVEGDMLACAYSWNSWQKHLCTLHQILWTELNSDTYIKLRTTAVQDELPAIFVKLFVEVFKQVLHIRTTNLRTNESQSFQNLSNKRQKFESEISVIISSIQESKGWSWINFVTELLQKYPKLLTSNDFVALLRVLSVMQAECRFPNICYHLYKCLAVLVDVESDIDPAKEMEEANSLWMIIWDCTLRAVGLNENVEQTHKLLQNLIIAKKASLNILPLFKMYTSKVINVSQYSLETLNIGFLNFGMSDDAVVENNRKTLIDWILFIGDERLNDTDVFSKIITARTLLFLIFKQWPNLNVICKNESICNTTLELTYARNSFENGLAVVAYNRSVKQKESAFRNDEHLEDPEVSNYLKERLQKFFQLFELDSGFNNVKTSTDIIIFLANILSIMVKCKLVDEDSLPNNAIFIKLKLLIEKNFNIMSNLVHNTNKKKLWENQLLYSVKCLEIDSHKSVTVMIRHVIPQQLAINFFKILENIFEMTSSLSREKENNLVEMLINFLCYYANVPDAESIFEIREHALNALVDNFEVSNVKSCEMILTIIAKVSKYHIGTLNKPILDSILKKLQTACKLYYTNNDCALKILQILKDLYGHIFNICDVDLKENSIILLEGLHLNFEIYGTKTLVALIQCMGELIKLDEFLKWSNNESIILAIPNFLASNFQMVRLAAIDNLSVIFGKKPVNKEQLLQQQALFNCVCSKCKQTCRVSNFVSEEHKLDEITTRTSSCLYIFATIMTSNLIFRQKALFEFIKIVQQENLNSELALRALQLVARHLSVTDAFTFIELNLNYLISQWHVENFKLNEFPYTLLGCNLAMEFYSKYSTIIVPFLITDHLTMVELCQYCSRSIEEALEIVYPAITARIVLASMSEDIKVDVQFYNRCHQKLVETLTSERLEKLLIENLDEVVVAILKLCFDPVAMNDSFGVKCIFPEPQPPSFSVTTVLKAFTYLKEKYLNNLSLIAYFMTKNPRQLQKVILRLAAEIYKYTDAEEKVKAYHHYVIFVELIVPYLKEGDCLSIYLVHTISHMLIYLIYVDSSENSISNVICCTYFSHFISQVLPQFSYIIEKCLVTFVGILVPMAGADNDVAGACIDLLNLLIIKHKDDLVNGIKTLDPFPAEKKFYELQAVYENIKYKDKTLTLEDEMEYFLYTGDLISGTSIRTEGLKYLKEKLWSCKSELKILYTKLYDSRGFSEDCEKSILHRLICVLVKLSLSSDLNESMEASRCLGELGAADLLSTVLQAERRNECGKRNPLELVIGSVLPLLNKYIVDKDVKVVQIASEALYCMLNCKEGKTVIESNIDYGHGKIDKTFLAPFISTRKIRADTNYNLKNDYKNAINDNTLWNPQETMLHDEWITKLVCTILESFTDKCYLNSLIPLCKVKVDFAEHLLPLLLYLLVHARHSGLISVHINRFFEIHWNCSLQKYDGNGIVAVNKMSVQCMLNVVHFIRLRSNVEKDRLFEDFNLNYLHVAQAAQFCTAHFTALLYVDLWYHEKIKEHRITCGQINSSLTPLEAIFRHEDPNIRQKLQNILKECYKKVGEMDALSTCETIGLLGSRLHVEHYENLQKWDQVALLYDIQVSQGKSESVPKLLESLKNCSLLQLPLNYKNSVETQFECAWRLSQWNISKSNTANLNGYEKHKYFALKALHENDTSNLKSALMDARTSILSCLRHASLESSKNLYEHLSRLQSLQDIEDFVKAKTTGSFVALFKKWQIQDEINRNEFQYFEPIQAQRIVMLKNCSDTKEILIAMHMKLAGIAKLAGNINVANRALSDLLNIPDLKPEIQNQIMMEEAQLCWLDDKASARHILRILLNRSPSPRLHAAALQLYGKWMVEICSENPQTVISNYFKKSIEILKDISRTDEDEMNLYETYDVLARFADSEYQQILTYVKSSVFKRKVYNMKKSKETATNMKKQRNVKLSYDESKAIAIHERQSAIDEAEIDNTYKEQNTYLLLAMKFYMLNLQYSDVNNARMFRVLALMLENRSNVELQSFLSKHFSLIPSYKYISILPQLVPHLTANGEDFVDSQVARIVERCAIDHPYHTLPFILALAHSNKDRDYCKSTTNTTSNESQVTGAEKLIEKLSKGSLKDLILKMEVLSNAIMDLAYLDYNKCKILDRKKQIFYIPNNCNVSKIKNFEVLLPTHILPIKKNCVYTDVVEIHSFDKTFELVGGLNMPKRISCMGTDGVSRNQLVKGKDDLRQDAVMQQVFNILNDLLATSKLTAKLRIRTYKIVPLSQRSGILEWVENSMPIGDYLVGKDKTLGAHQIYNPNDHSPNKCRIEFKNVAKCSNNEKLQVYNNICSKFRPVFHKFFEDSFVQPAVWYEQRRAYMYSVATSSMCGYILGLGDRHVNNILIDKRTAEVIHIDFGIAFEQGQVLPTPETVPFRLTRDIEAPMGVFGIEGVFRKSCEKTLEVLRNNLEMIITIVEVLLYDPLYAWTITPTEAYSRQFNCEGEGGSSSSNSMEFSDQENVNITAERALLRLRHKLQGTAEGGLTSIEGQVEKLLQQARDPSNLCRLFHGWQPYL